GLIDWLVSGLMEATINAAQNLPEPDFVRAFPSRVVRFTEETAAGSGQLKNYLRTSVYRADELVRARGDSLSRIAGLFDFYMAHPDKLPAAYLEESSGQPLHRVVCDYIAGMTDGFLLRTSAQLLPGLL